MKLKNLLLWLFQLSFSPTTPAWTHAKVLLLLGGILTLCGGLHVICFLIGRNAGINIFAFMIAEVSWCPFQYKDVVLPVEEIQLRRWDCCKIVSMNKCYTAVATIFKQWCYHSFVPYLRSGFFCTGKIALCDMKIAMSSLSAVTYELFWWVCPFSCFSVLYWDWSRPVSLQGEAEGFLGTSVSALRWKQCFT